MYKLYFKIIFIASLFFSVSTLFAEKIVLTGSSTLAPLMSEIAEAYENKNPDYRIDIQTGGSSRGIADASRGLADLGMSSRSLYEKELLQVDVKNIAMDGVAFILNSENSVKDLTSKNLKDIFTGKITNWKSLGGEDRKIIVNNRAKGRSEYDLVSKFLKIEPKNIKADAIAGENQQCVKIVVGNKDAISYLSIGTALYESQKGTKIKLTKLDGVEASFENVKNGEFPIIRPLLLVVPKKADNSVKNFLQFALSKEVQNFVKEQSFVSIN